MTLIGSCLPSAITVALVFLIVRKLTGNWSISLLSSFILLATVVFLSQATVLSQYPLPVMMTVLAFWFYLNDRRKLAVASLGIGAAMHFIVGAIAVFWLLLEWRQGRFSQWVRLTPLFFTLGVLPYLLTLWELWRYYGVINYQVLSGFISNTSGAAGLVVQLFPERLLRYAAWIFVSFGVTTVPIYYGALSKGIRGRWLILASALTVSWYYLTAQDTTVWHYLPWAMPFLAILAGVGMLKLVNWKPAVWVAASWVLVLLAVNAVYFNANTEAQQHPVATTFYNDIATLPRNAMVVADHLGPGATVRYVIASERPDIKRISSAEAPIEASRGADVYVINIDTLEVTRWR